MWETIQRTGGQWFQFYYDYLLDQWTHMTPVKYTVILVTVGVVGWILMKQGPKKC